jgi:hypothetical protein
MITFLNPGNYDLPADYEAVLKVGVSPLEFRRAPK